MNHVDDIMRLLTGQMCNECDRQMHTDDLRYLGDGRVAHDPLEEPQHEVAVGRY